MQGLAYRIGGPPRFVPSLMSDSSRSAVIDGAKALACTAIVWHHLAFYGPMSDVVHAAAPELIDWLVQYARMAVQVFLVLGGYLAAASLAPHGNARRKHPWACIGARFERLVVPYAAALVVVIAVNALVRPWLDDPAVASADPTLEQLLAHALLLHGVLRQESLSAGVWYVAIDFQLFALATLLLASVHSLTLRARGRLGWRWHAPVTGAQVLTVALVALSLLGFNRDSAWDVWAVYFFGAYGMGMLAYWSVHAATDRRALCWAGIIAVLTVLALAVQWRDRILLAGATALLLVCALRAPAVEHWLGWAPLRLLGRISYSVFLVHFALCLLVNALVQTLWPASLPAAVAGMALAWGASLLAGGLLYAAVEHHAHTWRSSLRWQAGLVGAGMATALIA